MRRPPKLWWVLGAIVIFVVALTLAERFMREEPAPSERRPTSTAPPEVRWTEDGAIELTEEPFRPSTIRLQDERKKQELFDCLEQGIEAAFGDGTEGWTRVEVWRETQRIKSECMATLRGASP